MKEYDYLVVGAGLFGSVFAHEARKKGKKCLIIEKNPFVAGHIYTEKIEGITIHKYGAHIFHTSSPRIWEYVRQFADFNHFVNSPIANYKGKLYNLPFNMNTFYQLWGVITPEEAKAKIEKQRSEFAHIKEPVNLEEQALVLGGRDIYETLIRGYTEKQWGRPATELPAFIIKRLPFRFTFDNNYFNDTFQGIPKGGYTAIVEKMLEGIEVKTEADYFSDRKRFDSLAEKVVFTGKIDEFFGYEFGELEYRSLHFENELLEIPDFQGNAVVNYTDRETPFTRIIEHKHFEFGRQPVTYITREYPHEFAKTKEPFYPVNNEKNQSMLKRYLEKAKQEEHVIFGGRLAEYKYYDMHQVIGSALARAEKELK